LYLISYERIPAKLPHEFTGCAVAPPFIREFLCIHRSALARHDSDPFAFLQARRLERLRLAT